jgi:hypothetical protein
MIFHLGGQTALSHSWQSDISTHTHTQESHQKLLLKTQPERLMTLQDKYSFRSGTGIVPAFAKQGPAEHCEPTRHQSTMAVQQLCVGGWMSDGQFLRDEKAIVRAAFFQNRFFHLLSFCGQWERRAAATVANDTQWMWWRSQEEAVAVPVVTGCSGSRRRPDFPSPDVSLSLVTTSQQWFHTLSDGRHVYISTCTTSLSIYFSYRFPAQQWPTLQSKNVYF